MEKPIYGVINSDNVLIDISTTLRGAKNYATRHGYTKVGYRIGYNAFVEAKKINGKWCDTVVSHIEKW